MNRDSNSISIETLLPSQMETPDFNGVLKIVKCTMYRTLPTGARRARSGKISKSNNLEMIPETAASGRLVTNNHITDGNDTDVEYESDGCSTTTQAPVDCRAVHGALHPTSKPSQFPFDTVPQMSSSNFHSISPKDIIDSRLSPQPMLCTPSPSLSPSSPASPRLSPGRGQVEVKSGVVVLISEKKRGNLNRNNNCNNSNLCYSFSDDDENDNSSSFVSSRTPVMLKVYHSNCGNYVVMTPSRHHHGAVQTQCLRLRNSQAYVTAASMTSAPATGSPCCFVLTLGAGDGKSFKFEASTRAGALEWVRALGGQVDEVDATAGATPSILQSPRTTATFLPLSQINDNSVAVANATAYLNNCPMGSDRNTTTSIEISINNFDKDKEANFTSNTSGVVSNNIYHINNVNNSNSTIPVNAENANANINTINNNNNKFNYPSPVVSPTRRHHLVKCKLDQTRQSRFTRNGFLSPSAALMRDQLLPTLSESSSECEEEWSEED